MNPNAAKLLRVSLITIIFVAFFVYLAICAWIGIAVKQICTRITYLNNDCVEGLIQEISQEDLNSELLNEDIWALGQLGDPRALPYLKTLQTGQDCDHDEFPCQYEIDKAINQIQDEINITRPIWFWYLNY